MQRELAKKLGTDNQTIRNWEADLDLNPRIGRDWMLPGTQRRVVTPGKNVKRYLAAALDSRTDRVTWVRGKLKNSLLFLRLLAHLLKTYPGVKLLHVILDNYTIHTSALTRRRLEEHGARLRLHFLSP